MGRLLRPARIDDPKDLLELVCEAVGEIIVGGVVLDTALGNDEFGCFDLVAANGDGEGVFFFVNVSGGEAEYLRLLKCMRWYRENRNTLQKLYAGRVVLGPAPPVFVVAPWYSNSMLKVLPDICGGGVIPLKYVCFQDGNGKRSLLMEKVGDAFEDKGKADSMNSPEVFPPGQPAGRPGMQPEKKSINFGEFRREIGTDISNVSDEELLDLLG
jgi:hypothetical protein